MRGLQQFVVRLGTRADRRLLILALVVLGVAWLVVLEAFDAQFRRVAGMPLLDLQSSLTPEEVLTPARALAQIDSYSADATSLYWSFFILDNAIPPLRFALYALLWANLLRDRSGRLSRWLLGTPAVLVPLGVGVFDWVENFAYVGAMSAGDQATATAAVSIGLVAKWIKVAFVQVTILTTVLVVLVVVLPRLRRSPRTTGPRAAEQSPTGRSYCARRSSHWS